MVLHPAFRARHVRKSGIGGEVRHGVTSGVPGETSLDKRVTPHLNRVYAEAVIVLPGIAVAGRDGAALHRPAGLAQPQTREGEVCGCFPARIPETSIEALDES